MKTIILLILFAFFANNLVAQSIETKNTQKEEKNILSIALGVCESDFVRSSYPTGSTNHIFGPAGHLEYQRVLSPYVRAKAKLFGGGIYRNDYNEIIRHVGLSCGVIVVPFGERLQNFQIGVAGAFICETIFYDTYNEGDYMGFYSYTGALEFSFKFNIIDNSKWTLGVAWDFYLQRYGFYTSSPTVCFGLKF